MEKVKQDLDLVLKELPDVAKIEDETPKVLKDAIQQVKPIEKEEIGKIIRGRSKKIENLAEDIIQQKELDKRRKRIEESKKKSSVK